MLYSDRFDAALKMLPCLKNYKQENAIIYALPGGGVPLGYYLAKNYKFPLELIHTKKINHPQNSDVTVGAVSLQDHVLDVNQHICSSYIKKEINRIRQALLEYKMRYSNGHLPVDARNKVVVIVDDGAATGNTLLAAIRLVRSQKPRKIIVAVPVAPVETVEKLKKEVDDLICLHTIRNVVGVSYSYLNFSKVTDNEIFQLLKSANGEQSLVA